MTRGKAIATVSAALGCHTEAAAHQVDMLAALGILKLDEPKQPYEILAKELGWGENCTTTLKDTLDRNGLRVVRVES